MQAYFTACASLLHTVLSALSLVLDVPSPGLGPTHSESLFQLRLLHYPAILASELSKNQRSRITAHSDFGTLTLLFQDEVGGLEIEDPHYPGLFRAAEPVDGSVLVNMGDLMARWSNGRWKSSVHRVWLPARFQQDEDVVVPQRYSIPVFAMPNLDTVIEALPGCWGKDRPKLFEKVTAGEYVKMRMAALYEVVD